MIEIAVGSQNPTKLKAVKLAFRECLKTPKKVNGYTVRSGVSDQPMDDEEMRQGARNRAHGAAYQAPDARFAVGMEGGIRVQGNDWFNLGWVCMIDTDSGSSGFGLTAAHRIPDRVRMVMEAHDLELSDAVTAIYGTDTANDRDCSGVITDSLLPADLMYKIGVLAAYADTYADDPLL